MSAPLLKGLLQMTKAFLSEGCVVAVQDHSFNDTDLVSQTLLALGDMLISLSKVFAFLRHVWHGLLIRHLIARTSHEIRRRPFMERWSLIVGSMRPLANSALGAEADLAGEFQTKETS